MFVKSGPLSFTLFITNMRCYKLTIKQKKNRKYYSKSSNNFAADCTCIKKNYIFTLFICSSHSLHIVYVIQRSVFCTLADVILYVVLRVLRFQYQIESSHVVLYVAVIRRYSCLPILPPIKGRITFFLPETILRVSCILWC